MTAKQILDAFSETLMQDERILSPRERELLMSLLQNSRAISSGSPETQSAVTATIARSVGETVAQRAFALLGGSIVEQILASGNARLNRRDHASRGWPGRSSTPWCAATARGRAAADEGSGRTATSGRSSTSWRT